MAGLPRKPDNERSGMQPRVHPTRTLMWDGEIRGPELPEDHNWSDQTLELWEMIRKSAQAMLFHHSDWVFLKNVMYLHNSMYVDGKRMSAKGEILDIPPAISDIKNVVNTLNSIMTDYGFTVKSRNQLGLNIITPDEVANEASSETAKAAVDYRSLLGG